METRLQDANFDAQYRQGLRDVVSGKKDTPEAQVYIQATIELEAKFRAMDHIPEAIMDTVIEINPVSVLEVQPELFSN